MMFEAYVTNLGMYPERGVEVGEYLRFPTTIEEVQALFSRIGIDGKRYEEYFITDYQSDVLGLYDHLGEYESLDELNYLAHLLEEMTQDELEKLEAVMDAGEYTGSVKDLINLTQNLDCFEFYPGVKDEEELGRINDLMNSQVSHNFARGIATWCYYDEFHVLLQDELTSSYFVTIWKMLRKKGCVPSALTQNVKDLLASRQIENIFENSDFMVLLSQAQGDRQILAKQLGISPHQLSYVTHSNPGEGLLFFGNVTIPFVDRFPKNTKLYSIMTTRPEEKEAQNG